MTFGKELAFKLTDAVINGDGAGKPQGILNSPATIVVGKGAASGNIIMQNILDMLARFWVGSRTLPDGTYIDGTMVPGGPKPAWFCHSDAVTPLAQLVVSVGSGGSLSFLFNPDTHMMMGFPVIPIEQCQPMGTVGDLILADMAEYQLALRDSGTLGVSMHVKFTTDEQAIRLILRCDGQSAWHTVVTPFNGTNTQSPFVVLQSR
jgi:hypothetical protein